MRLDTNVLVFFLYSLTTVRAFSFQSSVMNSDIFLSKYQTTTSQLSYKQKELKYYPVNVTKTRNCSENNTNITINLSLQ